MTPTHPPQWRGPAWTLALLLAALSSLGPVAIDAYLPAFDGIAASVQASPAQMQQTLSSFFLAMAVMSLFHGALSDSLGRRPLVLWGLGVFTLASVGCALASSVSSLLVFRVLQGTAAGAGMVVSRAIVRDLYPPVQAQRMMAMVTLFFGLAPVLAPLLGGLIFEWFDWQAIFWSMALSSAVIWMVNWRWLPETWPIEKRQPLAVASLMRGYASVLRTPRFVALALASSVPFNGFFIYVLSAPVYMGEVLNLLPSQLFWLFVATVSGIMLGASLSGRLAGRITATRQVHVGLAVMGAAALCNLVLNLVFAPHLSWALWPLGVFALGWSLMTPSLTLMALDLAPDRRGTAASLQACVGSLTGALVAGLLSPWVMHSALGLALASAALLGVGAVAWRWGRPAAP